MRLRVIILILSLVAVVSTSAGGLYYFFSLRDQEYSVARRRGASRTEMMQNQLSAYLSGNLNTVRALAGLKELRVALTREDPASLAAANAVLDHFQQALEVDVCYLMDRGGDTVASSNRRAPDSFVGQNFAFRPYFQEAISGRAGKYLALGTTSHKRGAYYSFPVFAQTGGAPLGVVVIKAPIGGWESGPAADADSINLLTGPHDVIFSSSRKQWLFKTLWPKSPEELAQVAASRQFGEGPWPWVGLSPLGGDMAEDRSGRRYIIFSRELKQYPGWKVVHLQSLRVISEAVWRPLARTTGLVVLGLCLFAGVLVYILHRKAGHEIAQRETAERNLRQAKEQLSHYSKELERQVRQRTREVAGFLEYTPAVVYMKDPQGRYIMVNSRWEQLFGMPRHEAQGKTLHEVFPPEVADQFRNNDLRVLQQKKPYQAEELFPYGDQMHSYLSVRFPILDEEGNVTRLCGISVDITDLKSAQDQLRRLSGNIMASQEKERTAIARELHDELGQVLTALRMDAVWLRDQLRQSQPPAAARADNMCRLIDKTISDVRLIATRLRPPVLDDLGLVDALEWYTTEFEKRTDVACVFNHFQVPEVGEFTAIAAYRVAQEALTNVARHAAATSVDVILRGSDGFLEVSVVDNGRGFDIKNLDQRKSLGIAGMRERASLAGGRLEIISQIGVGTEVLLKLPVHGLAGGLR